MKIENIPFELTADELKFVKIHLDKRMDHTRGTIELAEKLVNFYSLLEKIKLPLYKAALFHDCARELPVKEQKKLAIKFRGKLDKIENQNSALWHAPAGGQLLVEKLGYSSDNKVVQAVGYHSTGKSKPSPVLQGLIVADFTEKTRKFKAARELRRRVPEDNFNEITRKVLGKKIMICTKKNLKIHPRSTGAYNSLCD